MGQSAWIPNSVWRGWNPKEDGTIGGWLSYFILRRSRTYSDVLFHLEKESNVFRWLFLLTCDLKWHLMLVRWLLLPPWPFSGVQYKTVLVALSLSLICLVVEPSIHPSSLAAPFLVIAVTFGRYRSAPIPNLLSRAHAESLLCLTHFVVQFNPLVACVFQTKVYQDKVRPTLRVIFTTQLGIGWRPIFLSQIQSF